LLRIEMRHPFTRRFGFNPSVTYEKSSGVTTVDATGYARWRSEYAGLRLGNESTHDGRGGFFATVFIGWQGGRSHPPLPGLPATCGELLHGFNSQDIAARRLRLAGQFHLRSCERRELALDSGEL